MYSERAIPASAQTAVCGAPSRVSIRIRRGESLEVALSAVSRDVELERGRDGCAVPSAVRPRRLARGGPKPLRLSVYHPLHITGGGGTQPRAPRRETESSAYGEPRPGPWPTRSAVYFTDET